MAFKVGRFGPDVLDMDWPARCRHGSECALGMGHERLIKLRCGILGRHIAPGDDVESLAVIQIHCAEFGPADTHGVFQDLSNSGASSSRELLIAPSTSDVAVCCSSDSARSRSRPHLFKQTNILDRDHRLVGEGGDQLDLLLRVGLRHRLGHEDYADDGSIAHQRRAESRPVAADLLRRLHVYSGSASTSGR